MSVVYSTKRPSRALRSDIEIEVAEQVVPVSRDTCPNCRRLQSHSRTQFASQLSNTVRRAGAAAAAEFAEVRPVAAGPPGNVRTLAEAKAPGKVARGGPTCPPRRLPQLPLPLPHAACAQHQSESLLVCVTELETGRRFEPLVVDFEAVCGYAIAVGVEGATAGALVEDETEGEIRERRVWAVARFVASRVSVAPDGSAVSVGDLPLLPGATPPSQARHLAHAAVAAKARSG